MPIISGPIYFKIMYSTCMTQFERGAQQFILIIFNNNKIGLYYLAPRCYGDFILDSVGAAAQNEDILFYRPGFIIVSNPSILWTEDE